MPRPAIIDTLSARDKTLAANMYYRNENWDTIFKYISADNTDAGQEAVKKVYEDLEEPWSEALYLAYIDLAQVDFIMDVAAQEAEKKSPRHMAEYQKLGTHRMRIVKLIDELSQQERERGDTWEPSFDKESPEYRIFKAAMRLYLERDEELDDGFDELTPEEKARFFQILAEGA